MSFIATPSICPIQYMTVEYMLDILTITAFLSSYYDSWVVFRDYHCISFIIVWQLSCVLWYPDYHCISFIILWQLSCVPWISLRFFHHMHVTSPHLTYPCSHSHHRREVVSLHPYRQLAVFRRYPLAPYGMLQTSDLVPTHISISERLHKTVFVSISYNDSPATVCIFVTCLECSILYSTT